MPVRFNSTARMAALGLATLLVGSCSSRFDIALLPAVETGTSAAGVAGKAAVTFSASLEPQTARLVMNLSDFAHAQGEAASAAPLLDAGELERTLRASPGVDSVSLKNADTRSLSGTIRIGDVERFLTKAADGSSLAPAARFVRLESSASGGKLSVSLDRASSRRLLSSFSPDIVDYLSALLAPIASGEELGKAEYLELVKSMYGAGIAAEISGAMIRASIELPGIATSARGGRFSGRRVDFTLPLVDILVLEKPLILEATWK